MGPRRGPPWRHQAREVHLLVFENGELRISDFRLWVPIDLIFDHHQHSSGSYNPHPWVLGQASQGSYVPCFLSKILSPMARPLPLPLLCLCGRFGGCLEAGRGL